MTSPQAPAATISRLARKAYSFVMRSFCTSGSRKSPAFIVPVRDAFRALTILVAAHAPLQAQDYSDEPEAIASNFDTDEDVIGEVGEFPPDPATDEAKARFSCEVSHLNWDDSLLFPGLSGGSPHAHQYTSNTLSNANSTYASLRTTGNGTCSGNRINRSSYWFPAIYVDETHVKMPDFVVLYYNYGLAALDGQADDAYHTPVRLPRAFSMIGGHKPGDPDYYDAPPGVTLGAGQVFRTDPQAPVFNCGETGGDTTNFLALDCAAGDPLVININFPTCWDGDDISSADGRTHVTYSVSDLSSGKQVCPASHPYLIVSIEQKVYLSHNGPSDYENWWLASDRMSEDPMEWDANFSTMHMDYREAWDDGFRDIFQHFCNGLTYNAVTGVPHSCGDPHVGDGRIYVNSFVDFAETLDAQNIIDAPARTSQAVAVNGPRLRMRFRRR